jgi:hypothetical protein
MSSMTLSNLTDQETVAGLAGAVATVAERSFYAEAEPCDQRIFAALAAAVPGWVVATVRFEDGALAGSISCALPVDFAVSMFDIFSGGDPDGPSPGGDEVDDLIGEFSNMVCGAWLSRVAGDRVFRLSSPLVARLSVAGFGGNERLCLVISNRPVAIDLQFEPAAAA